MNESPKPPLWRWFIATMVIVGIFLVIFYSRSPDSTTPNEAGTLSVIAEEPANPLAEERSTSAEERTKGENEPRFEGKIYFVSLSGNDSNTGLTADQSFESIQQAVDIAKPGDTVQLAAGSYLQDIVSRSDGTPDKRITITGTRETIVKGDGNGRVIEINHDYITLAGFTVDGHFGSEKKEKYYRDKLIFALGKDPKNGVTGLRIENMLIENALGECVRLRYFAEKNEITGSTIKNCGLKDFVFDGDGKNGEGIYIGTAPEQLKDGTNPTKDIDVSQGNWIHHNTIDTKGNECIDIKEGSTKNIIEYNSCTGQKDKESGGMGSRGNENVFRFNEIFDNRGAGIRLGGDKKEYGIKNFVHDNTIRDNREGGIKIMRQPQGKICDNQFSDNRGGNFVGEYGEDARDSSCKK